MPLHSCRGRICDLAPGTAQGDWRFGGLGWNRHLRYDVSSPDDMYTGRDRVQERTMPEHDDTLIDAILAVLAAQRPATQPK